MELPKEESYAEIYLKDMLGENIEHVFSREKDELKIDLFESKKGFSGTVNEINEKGETIRQHIFVEQEGLVPFINNTIEDENERIPNDAKIIQSREEGLILSTEDKYIILPENGSPDFTEKS